MYHLPNQGKIWREKWTQCVMYHAKFHLDLYTQWHQGAKTAIFTKCCTFGVSCHNFSLPHHGQIGHARVDQLFTLSTYYLRAKFYMNPFILYRSSRTPILTVFSTSTICIGATRRPTGKVELRREVFLHSTTNCSHIQWYWNCFWTSTTKWWNGVYNLCSSKAWLTNKR